jgi:hypothetical protein
MTIVAMKGPGAAHDALPREDAQYRQQLELHPALAVDAA